MIILFTRSPLWNTLVGIDVGCRRHRVAVGQPDGTLIDQFDLDHQPASFVGRGLTRHKPGAKHQDN